MELNKQLYNFLYVACPDNDVMLYAPPTNVVETADYYLMEARYSKNNVQIASTFITPDVAKASIDLFNLGEQLQAYRVLEAASWIRYGTDSYDPVIF